MKKIEIYNKTFIPPTSKFYFYIKCREARCYELSYPRIKRLSWGRIKERYISNRI